MFQVVENAGQDNERIVFEDADYMRCHAYIKRNYTNDEIDEMCVDILKDYSTEH